jgi:hypothetical protein
MTIELGMKVRDLITGIEGIVTARTEWLNQCNRYVVQPQETKDGKPVESSSFDEMDLEIVEVETEFTRRVDRVKQAVAQLDLANQALRPTGGPRPAPSRSADPR